MGGILGILLSLPILAGSFSFLFLYSADVSTDEYPSLFVRAELALESLAEFAGLENILSSSYEDAKAKIGLTEEEFRIEGLLLTAKEPNRSDNTSGILDCPLGIARGYQNSGSASPIGLDICRSDWTSSDIPAIATLPFGPKIPLVGTGSYSGIYDLYGHEYRLILILWEI